MQWLEGLATELAYAVRDSHVWVSIGQALLICIAVTAFGVWLARLVGLLSADVPAGETIGVGLAAGLMVIAAWWAALISGGRSSFTPVAIGFAAAVILGVFGRTRTREGRQEQNDVAPGVETPTATEAPDRRRPLVVAGVAGGLFVVVIALLYASTMALSPRDGVQPVEFMDEAFYSVLAKDLATTGTESILSPSGFTEIAGTSTQNWYHWGELWLASATIKVLGVAPILARHFIILPILLLAAASLMGTLVRRINRTWSLGAFLVGFVSCVYLAPIPVLFGPFFSNWAVGLVFGISLYGLAAVALLLVVVAFVKPRVDTDSWAFAAAVGSVIAAILPAHIVLAALASIGGASLLAIRFTRARVLGERIAIVPTIWRRTLVWGAAAFAVTLVWGLLTGHGVPASASSVGVAPFGAPWSGALLSIAVGAGSFYAIPVAWLIVRRQAPMHGDAYVTTTAIVAAAALVWGARLGDFNTFHVFFAAVAVIATPAAASAMWVILVRVRDRGYRRLAVVLVLVVVLQFEIGVVLGTLRLQRFGPGNYEPVPLNLITAMRTLPEDTRIAYACAPLEEVSYWDARLLAIGVHADRRMVPMCFEADSFGPLVGKEPSLEMSPLFATAPQRALFPDATTQPSPGAVSAFLHEHGIDYIYADDAHPNRLVPEAPVIIKVGQFHLLAVP